MANLFKTDVLGIGPFCVEFDDGEIVTTRDEKRQHLIAAASDMYEVCKRAKELLQPEVTKEPDRTIFWELVAAIAKVEGRK